MSTVDSVIRRGKRRMIPGYDRTALSVKREPDEDIKDYAETTMNELLGWYGYEKVDSRDTQGLNLTHFASNPSRTHPDSSSPPSSAVEGSDASEDVTSHPDDATPSARPESVSPGPEAGSSVASDEVARQHQQMVSALPASSKLPDAPDSPSLPPGCIVCAWCQKIGMKLFTLKTPSGCKAFCSELCFTQCRRASFKKNKICDWCKHVRHTVNYVDFQDGEQQLQFCSDKCLNQYKMNIFCNETQAHLQMHTHLKEAACKLAGNPTVNSNTGVNLITPDLWLRDCKQNGNPGSPSVDDVIIDDVASDDNICPSPAVEVPRSKSRSPPMKEKKDQKPRPVKDREKSHRRGSSRPYTKKGDLESKVKHKDRKSDVIHMDAMPNHNDPPMHTSPTSLSHGTLTNGSTPHLSSPPMGPLSRPPHLPPPRHCPPSPLNIGMEQGRQSFFPPNLVPPSFHFLAQQQMEAILRSHHGLDLRSKVPPMPMPPWVMPPFPQGHPPPPPPPPPTVTPKSPLPLSTSPEKNHNHHHHHQQPKSSHHSKHKQKHMPSNATKISVSHRESNAVPPMIPPPPSLLPPVTVMVPFPLVVPIPVPIPIPIPVRQDVFDRLQQKIERQSSSKETSVSKSSIVLKLKRKKEHESSKHAPVKRRKSFVSHYSVEPAHQELFDEDRSQEHYKDSKTRADNLKTRKSEVTNKHVNNSKASDSHLKDYYAPSENQDSFHDKLTASEPKNCKSHVMGDTLPDFLRTSAELSKSVSHVDGMSSKMTESVKVNARASPLPLDLVRNHKKSDDLGLHLRTLPVDVKKSRVKTSSHRLDQTLNDNDTSRISSALAENLSLRVLNSVTSAYKDHFPAGFKDHVQDIDHNSSGSISPLSDAAVSNSEDKKLNDSNNNTGDIDMDSYSRITFSPYNLNSRSSPVASPVTDGLPNSASSTYSKPDTIDEKDTESTNSSFFKRKCLRDSLSLMT